MRIEQVFLSLDLAIGSYRRAVGTVLPALTKVAWQIKSQEIRKDAPGITRKKFLYNLSRSSYEKNWGATYQRPGLRSRILAGFFRIVPRIGPFKALAFKKLTPETEKLYMWASTPRSSAIANCWRRWIAAALPCPTTIST